MRIIVEGKQIKVDDEILSLANKIANKYLEVLKEKCFEKGQLMLYLCILITLQANTGVMLQHLDSDTMKLIEEINKIHNNKDENSS